MGTKNVHSALLTQDLINTRSAKAKNKVVCRRNRDLIFTVSSQSGDRHKIGEREQLQQNIIKILIFGLTCKNSLSLSCDKITMINDLVTLV